MLMILLMLIFAWEELHIVPLVHQQIVIQLCNSYQHHCHQHSKAGETWEGLSALSNYTYDQQWIKILTNTVLSEKALLHTSICKISLSLTCSAGDTSMASLLCKEEWGQLPASLWTCWEAWEAWKGLTHTHKYTICGLLHVSVIISPLSVGFAKWLSSMGIGQHKSSKSSKNSKSSKSSKSSKRSV